MDHRKLFASLLPASALILAGIAVPRADEPAAAASVTPASLEGGAAPALDPHAPTAVPLPVPPELPRIGERHLDARLGRYVAPLGDGRAILTIDPRLEARLEKSLETYRVPWGATVLIEASTGRVLALAEHSNAEPGRTGLAVTPIAPAASIFKIVTAAALLERGVGAHDEICYHGGKRRLDPRLLHDDPRRDRRCLTLTEAFGHSANVVFAKLADRDLDAATLRATAGRFLFNASIPFQAPVEMSPARIPSDPFQLANTAAGFGDVRLSPLHGALLASIVANGGLLVPPVLVDDAEGVPVPAPPAPHRILDEAVAAQLADMMRATVTSGTARRAFHRPSSALRGVAIAGKTGSLSDRSPFKDYSWFVGFAPADRPEVVVATVVVNGRLWHARAPQVAKEALEAFFATRVAMGAGPGALRTAAAR